MKISKKYIVYELNGIMGTQKMALSQTVFKGIVSNSFDSEEEAIEAIEKNGRTYIEFLIIPRIYMRDL